MNIVSLIMQYLGPIIIGKLASSFGVNSTIAQKIIAAALPTILAGIVGRVTQPGGAQALSDLVGKQDPGLLGNLGNLVGGAQQGKVAEAGMSTLGSLLGNTGLGALTSAIGKFGGVNDTVSKGMLGLLAPVVLGTLGQQQKSSGLDAAGLGKMLIGQKDNIQAAMPADFAKLLGGSGLIDSLGSTAKAAPPQVAEAPRHTSPAPAPAAGLQLWQWAALAALAALAGWYFLGSSPSKMVSLPKPPSVMAGNTDIGSAFGTTLGSLQSTLGTIKDKTSAEAALPQLRTAQGEIDRLSGLAGSLSGDGKKSLASYLGLALPLLMPVIDNLLANSSYGPIIKPLIAPMISKLQGLSKT